MTKAAIIATVFNAIIAGIIAKILDVRDNRKKTDEKKKEVRPFFDIDVDLPPDDGIGVEYITYRLINVGVGIAFGTSIKSVQQKNTHHNETVSCDMKIITPSQIIHPMKEYDVNIHWHRTHYVRGAEILSGDDLLSNAYTNKTEEIVFVIEYKDVYGNRYSQTLEIEYSLSPSKVVSRDASEPIELRS